LFYSNSCFFEISISMSREVIVSSRILRSSTSFRRYSDSLCNRTYEFLRDSSSLCSLCASFFNPDVMCSDRLVRPSISSYLHISDFSSYQIRCSSCLVCFLYCFRYSSIFSMRIDANSSSLVCLLSVESINLNRYSLLNLISISFKNSERPGPYRAFVMN
jgi:hypothetical protein